MKQPAKPIGKCPVCKYNLYNPTSHKVEGVDICIGCLPNYKPNNMKQTTKPFPPSAIKYAEDYKIVVKEAAEAIACLTEQAIGHGAGRTKALSAWLDEIIDTHDLIKYYWGQVIIMDNTNNQDAATEKEIAAAGGGAGGYFETFTYIQMQQLFSRASFSKDIEEKLEEMGWVL